MDWNLFLSGFCLFFGVKRGCSENFFDEYGGFCLLRIRFELCSTNFFFFFFFFVEFSKYVQVL